MTGTKKIRLGGVPEHFNLPIHLAIERGDFENEGIDVSWTDFFGGTGEMTEALENDSIDICILLTEGIIKAILKGNPSSLISVFVETPLCWGVHTGANNELEHYDDIWTKRFAISRFGSGSHLMPLVDANKKEEFIENDQFAVVNGLKQALISLEQCETDVFYWEKFTTKPFVDNGKLRRIGEFYSPWPCFVMAARNSILEQQESKVRKILKIIHSSCSMFMNQLNSPQLVSERYDIHESDAERWFHSTEWAEHGWISNKMIEGVLYHLKLAGIIETEASSEKLIWK